MAKVRSPLFSTGASGSLASLLLFSRGRRSDTVRSIARLRLSPSHGSSRIPSAVQLAQRDLYAARVAAWHAARPAAREEFRPLADARGWTLFNAWMSARPTIPLPQHGTIWDGGSTTWDGGKTSWDI